MRRSLQSQCYTENRGGGGGGIRFCFGLFVLFIQFSFAFSHIICCFQHGIVAATIAEENIDSRPCVAIYQVSLVCVEFCAVICVLVLSRRACVCVCVSVCVCVCVRVSRGRGREEEGD